MRESGYYPPGAEFDPCAPWNQKDPDWAVCDACGGKGQRWYAYNIETDSETECTEETWICLPETEEEAEAKNQHYCRGDIEACEDCGGTGIIEYENRHEQ